MLITINQQEHPVPPLWENESLLDFLRDHLGLTGSKFGCGAGGAWLVVFTRKRVMQRQLFPSLCLPTGLFKSNISGARKIAALSSTRIRCVPNARAIMSGE